MKRTSAGFTLVEVVVVIAIVIVLAGLTTSVFSGALRRSRAAVCTSNLRQIGHAVSMYVADNDSAYPQSASGLFQSGETQGTGTWYRSLRPYIGNKQTLSCPDRQLPVGIKPKSTAFNWRVDMPITIA